MEKVVESVKAVEEEIKADGKGLVDAVTHPVETAKGGIASINNMG